MLHGWPPTSRGFAEIGDPAGRLFAVNVVNRAEELRVKRDRQRWDNLIAAVQTGIARAFPKGM